MNWIKEHFALVALVVVMIAVSCTTERDAVDKSPELSLDKRLFEGEFFSVKPFDLLILLIMRL